MANPSTAHEPSMEEILASIRQIISDDGEGPSKALGQGARSASSAPEPTAEAEIEPAPYETIVSRFESEPALQPAPVIESRLPNQEATRQPPPMPDPAPERAEAAPQSHLAPLARRPTSHEEVSLMSPESSAVVSGAFGTLTETLLTQNSRTLEEIVAEMLQPMLKSWLDDNLPSLVERMVQEEIERVSRGRR